MKNKLVSIWDALEYFCKENPLEFDKEEMDIVKGDIIEPRKGIVSDQYVDFLLWKQGLKSRQASFAEFIQKIYPVERYPKLLEVGCGKVARLSKLLAKQGYKMSAMDPKVQLTGNESREICCIKEYFDWERVNLAEYDAVIAQEPCEASEHIVRACLKQQKNLVMALCGVPHQLLNGVQPQDVYSWYRYLKEIGEGKCVLTKWEIVDGYSSFVLII